MVDLSYNFKYFTLNFLGFPIRFSNFDVKSAAFIVVWQQLVWNTHTVN